MNSNLFLKQFITEPGCYSYIVADRISKEAIIIDPLLDEVESYLEMIETRALKLKTIIDTHTHADHYSGSHLLKKETGVEIAMSEHSKSARVDRRLKDRDVIELGSSIASSIRIEVISSPGHTPDSLSLLIKMQNGSGLLFTGDTLFIGGSGRTDFPGASPEAQFSVLKEKLSHLPADTIPFPGHDYSGVLFSTLGEEDKSNPHLKLSREKFIEEKKAEALCSASGLPKVIQFNLEANPTSRPMSMASSTPCSSANVTLSGNIKTISIDEALKLEPNADLLFFDVREEYEHKLGFIPKSENIPLSEICLELPRLQKASRIILSCQSGRRSLKAAQTLARLGMEAKVENLTGGYLAYSASYSGL